MAAHGTRECRRAWRVANPDKVKAHKRAYYLKHREQVLAKSNARYVALRESISDQRRQQYASEREKRQALARAQYAADPERRLANNRKYRAARLDEFRERDRRYAKVYQENSRDRFVIKSRRANHKRRALKLGAFVENVDPLTVFSRDNGVCGICHKEIVPTSQWHVDHVIPLSKGGMHSYANVQLAHARCNWSKRDQMLVLGGAR